MAARKERFEFVPSEEELTLLKLLAKGSDRSVSWHIRNGVEAYLITQTDELRAYAKQFDVTLPAEYAEPVVKA